METPRAEVFWLLEDGEAEELIKRVYDKPYDAYSGRMAGPGTQFEEIKAAELDPTELLNWGKPNPARVQGDPVFIQPRLYRVLADLAFRKVLPPGLYLLGSLPERF